MGRMKQSQITYWCHEIIRSQAEEIVLQEIIYS